jgi:hypothetical protein
MVRLKMTFETAVDDVKARGHIAEQIACGRSGRLGAEPPAGVAEGV